MTVSKVSRSTLHTLKMIPFVAIEARSCLQRIRRIVSVVWPVESTRKNRTSITNREQVLQEIHDDHITRIIPISKYGNGARTASDCAVKRQRHERSGATYRLCTSTAIKYLLRIQLKYPPPQCRLRELSPGHPRPKPGLAHWPEDVDASIEYNPNVHVRINPWLR